jgi:hypothetical protein
MPKTASKKTKTEDEVAAASAVKPEMDLRIKAVGGLYNGEYVGRVRDVMTALRLLHLIRLTGGHACIFSGFGVLKEGVHREFSLDAGVKMLMRSRILTTYTPEQRQQLDLSQDKI